MNRGAWVAVVFALLGTIGCAFALTFAPHRGAAWVVVPIAWLWGLGVVASATSPPGVRHGLAAAALCRFVLVGAPPLLSDDLFRYLWEGQALLAGHNPLYESPDALTHLNPALHALVNHPELPSVYPPLALVWFAAIHALGGTAGVAQGLAACADLVIVACLYQLRPKAGWLYALLPLPVLESAVGAHIDVPAIALATVAVLAFGRSPLGGWTLLVAGALTKLLPVVALPTAWRALAPRQRLWVPVATLVIVIAAIAPMTRMEVPPGLLAYGTRWSFNGLLHTPSAALLGGVARPLLVVIGLAVSAVVVARARTPLGAWAAIGAAFVCLSPTMHPWYVLWALVPALALGIPGAGTASVFVSGSYLVLATYNPTDGTWSEEPWLWAVTWLPALTALALGAWRHWRGPPRSDPEPHPDPDAIGAT